MSSRVEFVIAEVPVSSRRTLPEITPETAHFWTSGRRGALEILHCTRCDYWVHPPGPVCPACFGDIEPRPVSGDATVHSYTVNHHAWTPELEVPYVVAIVELPEQEGLRLITNIVDCPPEQVRIGMPVRVVFERVEDVHLPLFRRVSDGG
jgi:uncharacterized OB-fold protein